VRLLTIAAVGRRSSQYQRLQEPAGSCDKISQHPTGCRQSDDCMTLGWDGQLGTYSSASYTRLKRRFLMNQEIPPSSENLKYK
jgi:hypothetical protein